MAIEIQHIVSQRFVQCVKFLIEGRKVSSARQLALSLDYTPQGLSEIMLGKRNVPVDLIRRVVEQYHVNVRFLFSGQGKLFEEHGLEREVLTHIVVTDHQQREEITHIPVAAHAGYRDNLTEPVFMQSLPTYRLPENILRQGSYRSFEVAGDSMEPTILPGDKVIGAYVEPQFWEQGIKDNAIHVLITYHEILVKRIQNFIRSDGMLELHSDNGLHRPFQIPIEDLREAWVVRLRITGNLTRPHMPEISILDNRLHEQEMLLEELRNQVAELSGSGSK